MSPDEASSFRALLELVGGITLAVALGVSLIVQVDVWRGVTRKGRGDEHDDFKIRAAERRCADMRKVLEQQEGIVARLDKAHNALHKGGQASQGETATFDNPMKE
jgi:hypothetical protein